MGNGTDCSKCRWSYQARCNIRPSPFRSAEAGIGCPTFNPDRTTPITNLEFCVSRFFRGDEEKINAALTQFNVTQFATELVKYWSRPDLWALENKRSLWGLMVWEAMNEHGAMMSFFRPKAKTPTVAQAENWLKSVAVGKRAGKLAKKKGDKNAVH